MTPVEMVRKVVEWWTSAGTAEEGRGWFTEEFVIDSHIRLLNRVASHEDVTLMFEGVEGITGLRYRVAWSIRFSGERISRILDVYAIMPPEPDRIHWSSQADQTD